MDDLAAYRGFIDPIVSQLPALRRLRGHFTPDPACVPQIMVQLAPIASYECLIGVSEIGAQDSRSICQSLPLRLLRGFNRYDRVNSPFGLRQTVSQTRD